MPDTKTYHPGSFAYATLAVAEDLERIAEELRIHPAANQPHVSAVERAAERLAHQASALRAIAQRSWDNDWDHYTPVAMPSVEALDEYPPVDPDADGPSFDDPPGGR